MTPDQVIKFVCEDHTHSIVDVTRAGVGVGVPLEKVAYMIADVEQACRMGMARQFEGRVYVTVLGDYADRFVRDN